MFLLFTFIFPLSSFAFNYQQCHRFAMKHSWFSGPVTTLQFTSSTGACSALASNKEMQKRFYIVNYNHVMNDFSKGSGEYANAFFAFSSCTTQSRNLIIKNIKNDFVKIYELSGEDSFSLIRKSIQINCPNV